MAKTTHISIFGRSAFWQKIHLAETIFGITFLGIIKFGIIVLAEYHNDRKTKYYYLYVVQNNNYVMT